MEVGTDKCSDANGKVKYKRTKERFSSTGISMLIVVVTSREPWFQQYVVRKATHSQPAH